MVAHQLHRFLCHVPCKRTWDLAYLVWIAFSTDFDSETEDQSLCPLSGEQVYAREDSDRQWDPRGDQEGGSALPRRWGNAKEPCNDVYLPLFASKHLT